MALPSEGVTRAIPIALIRIEPKHPDNWSLFTTKWYKASWERQKLKPRMWIGTLYCPKQYTLRTYDTWHMWDIHHSKYFTVACQEVHMKWNILGMRMPP